MEIGLYILIGVAVVVSLAFWLIFKRQDNAIRKISGRGGDFAE